MAMNQGATYPHRLDAYTPFQIDNNFGATSSIAEMLLENQGRYFIDLLPALDTRLLGPDLGER